MTFRPALRPGAPLLRRSATHLQVGTSPGIVIVDRPGLAALLRLLDGVRDVDRLQQMATIDIPELDEPVATVLTELRAVGAVVDATAVSETSSRRASVTIGVDAGRGTTEIVRLTRSALSSVGITSFDAAEPELVVIASLGEAARSVFERASLLGVDHLPVVIDEDRVRIGPFVRPGRTPCVGCHDLHRADWDPAWPALIHQLGRRPPLAQPAAVDPLSLHSAAIELAAEIVALVDGHTPRTVGRCLVIGPAHDERSMWPVAFHHRCACDLLNAA